MLSESSPRPLRRRDFLRLAGGSLLLLPLLSACQRSFSAGVPATSRWITGGTARIGDLSRFPKPFQLAGAQQCALTCAATIGPCHTESPQRVDVSEGWDGLPLRLALRVVDTDCRPLPDAIVEIWHTNYTGGYSGRIADMCNNDAADTAKGFFRGYQRTDKEGVVNFNTCYPGWYRGRAVHMHLRVMTGAYVADDQAADLMNSWVVTQLLFPDALNQEIFSTVPLYKERGQPDTTLADDGVVGGAADPAPFLFDVQHMDDGVMFASKTLVVRKSQSDALCEIQGRGGPPGGPSGGGFPGGKPPPGMPPRPPQAPK